MKRTEEQLDLFGAAQETKRNAGERNIGPPLQPRRTQHIAGPTPELFDDFELLPTGAGSRAADPSYR